MLDEQKKQSQPTSHAHEGKRLTGGTPPAAGEVTACARGRPADCRGTPEYQSLLIRKLAQDALFFAGEVPPGSPPRLLVLVRDLTQARRLSKLLGWPVLSGEGNGLIATPEWFEARGHAGETVLRAPGCGHVSTEAFEKRKKYTIIVEFPHLPGSHECSR
jgi:hypothetical protein